ncbi:hypothetical protein V6N13_142258 [Hibiscus sabdariffa]
MCNLRRKNAEGERGTKNGTVPTKRRAALISSFMNYFIPNAYSSSLIWSTRFGSNVTVSIIHGAHKVYVGSAISHGVTPSTTSDDNTYEGRLPSEGQHEEEGQGAAVDDRQAMSDTSNGLTDRAQLVSVAKIVVPEMSSVGPDITASTKLDVRQSSESLHSDRVSHEEPGATIEVDQGVSDAIDGPNEKWVFCMNDKSDVELPKAVAIKEVTGVPRANDHA